MMERYAHLARPSNQELLGIVDYSLGDPGPPTVLAVNATYFLFDASQSQYGYWTSTQKSYESNPSAFYVDFTNGSSDYSSKTSQYYVRCVHGAQVSYGNFVVNGDGTVTDQATGLMWQPDDVSTTTWGQALSHCKAISPGSRNWRLLNIRELTTLVDYSRANPSMNTTIFSNANRPESYWSSTTETGGATYAWYVYITTGAINSDEKTVGYWTKCVTCAELPVKNTVTTIHYSAVQPGLNDAESGDILQLQSQPFPGNLLVQNSRAITLKGGYNCDYSSNHGFSTISGKVTIGIDTTIKVENIIIR